MNQEESEVEDNESDRQQSGGEEDEAEDSEWYEIEAILDARKGIFEKKKFGYLVKWKGYGSDQNSWVAEADAGNATDLIDAYWDQRNKKKAPKKVAKKESKRSRKCMEESEYEYDPDDPMSMAKTRGRDESVLLSDGNIDTEDDELAMSVVEKPERKTSKKFEESIDLVDSKIPDDDQFGPMPAEYLDEATWDQLIQQIHTVSRVGDKLYVFFTLHGGEHVRMSSQICADKFPKLLLNFYEAHLNIQ
ncbi:Chromatin-associated protein swi6 [Mycena venus]|uniref:Chromatin-associated protein swi6 n=1 Tax=Mycena venus TaxID=2733690 RepID=A0A8H6X6Z8_9AGAR|nr:Chromatin-associated protein swi6 [Mycena venus]